MSSPQPTSGSTLFQGPFASPTAVKPNPADSNSPPKQWRFVGCALVFAAIGATLLMAVIAFSMFPVLFSMVPKEAFDLERSALIGPGLLVFAGLICWLAAPSSSGQRSVVFWGLLSFTGGIALMSKPVREALHIERSLAAVGSAALLWLAMLAMLSFLRIVARTFHRPLQYNLMSMLLWTHVIGLIFGVVAPGNPYGPAYLALGLAGTTLGGAVIALWLAAWNVPKLASAYDKPLDLPAVSMSGGATSAISALPYFSRLFSRHHGQWIWGVGLLSVSGLSFVAWARFGPVEHDWEWEAQRRDALRSDVPPHHNAYFDLAAIRDTPLTEAWALHFDAWTKHTAPPSPVTPASAADWKERTKHVNVLWQTARTRPFAQGHVRFDSTTKHPDFAAAKDYIKGALLATAADPDAFRQTVADAALMVKTLTQHSQSEDYQVAWQTAVWLRVALEAHFTLATDRLTMADCAALDVVLVDLERNIGSAENAWVASLLDSSDDRTIRGRSTLDRIQQIVLEAEQSRQADQNVQLAKRVEESHGWPNAKWAAEYKSSRFVLGLTTWERFRHYQEDQDRERKLGEDLQKFRQLRTMVMLMRVACRIEAIRRQTGKVPTNLDALAGLNWPNSASTTDDWVNPPASFMYEVIAPAPSSNVTAQIAAQGYRIGSRGSFPVWPGFAVARDANMGFEMLPRPAN